MRYFTPELLERSASLDNDVADAAEQEWERAIAQAKRRWRKIAKAFPMSVQRFEAQSVCLHDARVLSMARQGNTFVVIAQREPPAHELVLLTFTIDADPVIKPDAALGHGDDLAVTWLYEEWDVDRGGRCWFEVLLSNGWSVRLRFRDFRFRVLPQILPATNGQAMPQGKPAMPRSA
jgi:hypothetical protein